MLVPKKSRSRGNSCVTDAEKGKSHLPSHFFAFSDSVFAERALTSIHKHDEMICQKCSFVFHLSLPLNRLLRISRFPSPMGMNLGSTPSTLEETELIF